MAMNDDIYIMREAVRKLTQLLAGKSIQVTQRGLNAYVRSDAKGRPFLVNLPFIPDNATPELIDAIKGFLDHEVAHILFTDFTKMADAQKIGCGSMLNILEDARIEKAMQERFQGSAENLARTGSFFLDKFTTPRLAEATKTGDTDTIQGVLMVPLIRAMAGQQVFKDFMADKMTIMQPVYDKIKDLASKIESATSTDDCFQLSKTIHKRLRDEKPPAPPAPPPPPPAAAPTPAPAAPPAPAKKEEEDEEEEAPAKKEEDDDEDADEPDDSGEQDTDADADNSDETDGDTNVGDDGDDGDISVAGDDDGLGGASPGGAPAGAGGAEEHDLARENNCATWEALDKEMGHDYDDAISTEITNSAMHAAATADYLPYSTDRDVIETLHVGKDYDSSMLTRLEDTVNHMVGPLQKDLERAISARSLSQYSAGHRSGRLHSANLSRLATGDTRVFRRKHEVSSKDVAVELLIDMSGSMYGSKLAIATQAAYALSSVLERIGIANEVMCFTTGECAGKDHAEIAAEEAKLKIRFSRTESLYMPILKSFNERLSTESKQRFGWLPNVGDLRCNVDGESVAIAARRLMARRETGKILMVLSDGAPAGSGVAGHLTSHLKATVKKISKSGVNVIGIGINSTAVQQFYPKSIVLTKIEELPLVIMKELRALIIK
ncbi:MAG: hypothetical protein WKG03_05010 [Telluria sp.]